MEIEEPEMHCINCSDPQQNPAAGRLTADWLDREEGPARPLPVKEPCPYVCPAFCRPLNRDGGRSAGAGPEKFANC